MEILENVNQVVGEAVDGTADGVKKVSRVVFREFPKSIVGLMIALIALMVGGAVHEKINGRYLVGSIILALIFLIVITFMLAFILSPRTTISLTGLKYIRKGKITLIDWNEMVSLNFERGKRRSWYGHLHVQSHNSKLQINLLYISSWKNLKSNLLIFCPRQDLVAQLEKPFNSNFDI